MPPYPVVLDLGPGVLPTMAAEWREKAGRDGDGQSGKKDPNDPNGTFGIFGKGIEYLAASLNELRRGNRWNNAMYDRARAGSLRNSSGRIQVDPHFQTDALGNAVVGSADVILLQYPEDWDSCCEGDPPTARA